jgi:ABC-2 type transport system permease protein
MTKAFLVARWEFRAAVMRRAYVFSVIAMPLFFLGIGSISVLTVPRTGTGAPVAIVDKAGIVDVNFAAEQAARREQLRIQATSTAVPQPIDLAATASASNSSRLMAYDDEQRAVADLAARKIAAVYVIEADYLKSGNITAYGRDVTVLSQPAVNQRQNMVADAIRAGLLRQKVSDDVLARVYAPAIRIKALSVDGKGEVKESTNTFSGGRLLSTLGVFFLLTMSIFFSAGFLQQATIEDRQNRVFEILLSSLDPDELILGKIMGLGAAGLLQVGFYMTVIFASSVTLFPMIEVSVGRLALSLPYFVIGYLLFASLMAAIGMISRNAQESGQLTALWTLVAMAPMFFFPAISAAPNGLLSRVLSFFPLSSPVTMLLRLTIAPEVPVVDIIATIIIGGASVYLALRAITRIFRAATLMYGKRPTLPEFMRWLKADS